MNHHVFFFGGTLFHNHINLTGRSFGILVSICDDCQARIKDASRISEAALQAGLDLVKPGGLRVEA